jgi:hypothetical protein
MRSPFRQSNSFELLAADSRLFKCLENRYMSVKSVLDITQLQFIERIGASQRRNILEEYSGETSRCVSIVIQI